MQAGWQNPIFDLISDCADAKQTECYVIGGYVRDWLLNRPSKDIDIVVVGSGIELAKALKAKLGRKASLSIFKNFGTAQIKYKDTEIEFVGARKESYRNDSRKPVVENGTLEDDQKRRDFTINAMAICLNKSKYGELTDPFGGKQDLEYKILRTPLNPDVTFSDDPLRMMRCIRFATQLKFSIEDGTYRALQTNKERISIISQERILDELNKIMMSEKPSIGLDILYKCGLLEIIMPEISNLKGVEIISGKAHKDIFYHTLEVVDNVAKQSSDLWLRWAALFHDVGKPATKRFDPKIGWMFHNHNYIGEKMIPHIFKRMKFPMNEKMRYVQKIVSLHMRPIALVEEEITDSAVRRLLFEGGDDIEDLMTLCEADITSKNEAKVNKYMQNLQIVRLKLKDIEQKDHVRNFQPPIDGAEIMKTFGLEPCGTVGKIKAIIKDAILDGKIPNEYEPAHELMVKIAASMGLTPIK
ncbi:MAG TPA: HD domain-containing protein [Candidatus Enterocola sp.]|nr:HD domain-containing protein [Candidatus Enterocola sp.]